jgi:hypothetical protein
MDNQNQNPEPQQPIDPQTVIPSPSVGGQKVIQPTEGILQHTQSQTPPAINLQPHIVEPVSPTQPVAPVTNTDNQQTSQTTTYIPNTTSNDESVLYGHNQQAFKEPKKRLLKWVIIGLVIVIIAGLGVLVDKNPNLKATILRQKFVAYTYPVFIHKESFKITVNFYRGSTITDYAPPTPPGKTPSSLSSTLVSPVQKGASAIALRIVAGPINSQSQAAAAKFNSCNGVGESEGPTIYVPTIAETADMCQLSYQQNGETVILGYESGVVSPSTNTTYVIILSSNYSFQTTSQGTQIVNEVNFQNYQSDVQSIISSIKFIRE